MAQQHVGQPGESLLTLIRSISVNTLTQIGRNQQRRTERALHRKIAEPITVLGGAR